ncbi:hypothetical protein L6452_38658 [Arctium lappa]|uniref:Uncharacterized protein n=1 Tax=Arctium lappa TaxID=4217 RepID=A0ACB8XQL5_ARCLA|nr:hypothetical protein L6452_38658 [Arctium lappa]
MHVNRSRAIGNGYRGEGSRRWQVAFFFIFIDWELGRVIGALHEAVSSCRGRNTPIPTHFLFKTVVPRPHPPPNPTRTGLAMNTFDVFDVVGFRLGAEAVQTDENPSADHLHIDHRLRSLRLWKLCI